MSLEDLGWREPFISAFNEMDIEGALPGRVVFGSVGLYRVQGESGEYAAESTGKIRDSKAPAVGDWVVFRPPETDGPARILEVLPRKSAFSRNAAGRAVDQQVLSANIDSVFIVCGLDGDFNLRRIERYVTLAYNSGERLSAPVFTSQILGGTEATYSMPTPHALTLTSIVIGVATTALLLAFVMQAYRKHKVTSTDDFRRLRG